MEKSNNSLGDVEGNSWELTNFELKFFDGPQPQRFANLREQGLSELVEHRHSEKTKSYNKLVLSTFRSIRKCITAITGSVFSDFARKNVPIANIFWRRRPFKCCRRAKLVHESFFKKNSV